jgi:hypothetical protein
VRGSDKICHHDGLDGVVVIVLELDIAVSDDTQQLRAKLAGF